MDNTDDGLVIIRAQMETPKPYSKPAAADFSSLHSNSRTSSTSALSPGAALPSDLTLFSNSHNNIESMQDGFQKMYLECTSSSYAVHTSVSITASCYSSSIKSKYIESNKGGVNKMCSEISSSIYLHINPTSQ